MIDLRLGLTEAQVNVQVEAALADYGAATRTEVAVVGTAVRAQDDVSVNQVNAACAAALVDYDAATGEEIATVDAEVEVIEQHLHNREHFFGKSADQSGNNWGGDTLTAYRAISGNGVYGADANDEAKVIGSTDTPIEPGHATFDFREICVIALSSDTVYKIRIVWGMGTMADAIMAKQYSEDMLVTSTDKANKFGGAPFEVRMPILADGTRVWIQTRNATDNATMDFFVGFHEYTV